MDTGADRFASWLRTSLPAQPEEFLRELPPLFGNRRDILETLGLKTDGSAEVSRPEQVPSVPSEEAVAGAGALSSPVRDAQGAEPHPPTREQLTLLHEWADSQRARASAIDDLLEWTQHAMRRLDTGANELAEEQKLQRETLTRVASLEGKLEELETQRSELEAKLQSVARQQSQKWDRERNELLGRVEKTATARLQHYRERLVSSLRRELTEPLPLEGQAVSEALGAVLLNRLHGVLRILRREGIDAGEP